MRHVDDDLDLDALMVRVREAALGPTTVASAAPQGLTAAGDPSSADADLIRIIDAQGQWNEQTRQALVALADSLRTLRDDWADEQKTLRKQMGQLSALVAQLTASPLTAGTRRRPSAAASRGQRSIASPRANRARKAAKRAKQRS
jgi:peptidoglycan hydrolase CwlO-like protein